jgi:hypothetical protein
MRRKRDKKEAGKRGEEKLLVEWTYRVSDILDLLSSTIHRGTHIYKYVCLFTQISRKRRRRMNKRRQKKEEKEDERNERMRG